LASSTHVGQQHRREPQGRRIIAGAMAVSGAFGFFTVGATSVEALANRTNGTSTLQTASSATTTAESSTTHSLRTPSQAPAPASVHAVIQPALAPPSGDGVITPVLVTTTDDNSVATVNATAADSTADPTFAKLMATAR